MFAGKWMQLSLAEKHRNSFLFAVPKIYRGGWEWNYRRTEKTGQMGDVLSYSVLAFASVEWLGS